MDRSFRIAAGLLALALTNGSCSLLPPDHGFPAALGRSMRRAVDSVGSISRAVDKSGRDLHTLAAKAAAAPAAAGQEISRLQRAGTLLAEDRVNRLQQFWPRTQQLVRDSSENGLQRLASLRDAPARMGLDAERNLGNLRRSFERSPSVLRLHRTPMASPGDPERTVEIVPTERRRSWLERVLDRMAF